MHVIYSIDTMHLEVSDVSLAVLKASWSDKNVLAKELQANKGKGCRGSSTGRRGGAEVKGSIVEEL